MIAAAIPNVITQSSCCPSGASNRLLNVLSFVNCWYNSISVIALLSRIVKSPSDKHAARDATAFAFDFTEVIHPS